MKKAFLLVVLAVSALAAKAQQMNQPLPIDEKVKVGKLDNGLTYYIRHNEEPKGQAAFYIAHKVGSVQEEDNQQGLAHFLEHMAFNGSKHFPAGDVFSFIQRIGVTQFNAETGIDMTYYHLDNAPVTNPLVVDSCMLLLSDWSCQVEMTQEEIDKERDVIHGEYRMRDNAQQRMLTTILPQIYPGSKYADRMPIGKMEVIDNFKPEFLQAYYKKWYHPSLQAVIVVGDVDVDQIEAKIKTLFGPLQNPKDEAPYELYPVPDNDQPIYSIASDKEQQMQSLNLFWKRQMTPYEQRNTVAYLLEDYLTSIACSVVNERLADLALKADCPFIQAGLSDGKYLLSKTAEAMGLSMVSKPGKSAEAVQAVMTEIARARQHGFTQSELQRANDQYMASVEALYNNREKTANGYFAQQYLQNFLENNPAPSIELMYQLCKQLTGNLPAELYQQILVQKTEGVEKNFVLFAMCPENDVPAADALKKAVEAGYTAQTEALAEENNNEPLIASLPAPVKVKKVAKAPFGYTQWQLSNGANVYFKQTDFSDDEIDFKAVSKGGTNMFGNEYAPLTNLFINPQGGQRLSLFEIIASETGIAGFTGNQLKKKLAGKNASVELSLDETTDVLNGGSTVKDLRTLFELINLRFQAPSNDPDGYQNLISQLQMVMPQLDAMHAIIQADSCLNTYYQHNPHKQLIHSNIGEKMDYEMMRKAVADRFQSAGDFDFIFTGNINEDSLRQYVEQYIAPLPGLKKREGMKDAGIRAVRGNVENIYECEMQSEDASEVIVNVRWIADMAITPKNVTNAGALGSILSERLFKKVREDNSMGYSAGAQTTTNSLFEPYVCVTASANIKPEAKDECLRIIYNELEDIAKNGVSDEELKKFIEPGLTSLAQNERSNAYWAGTLTNLLLENYDRYTGRKEMITGVTSADVQKMAAALVKAGNRATVVMMPKVK